MILEFKVQELKEGTVTHKAFVEKGGAPNEFIIVGEEVLGDVLNNNEIDCFRVHQVSKEGIGILGDLKIDEFGLLVKKDDLKLKSDDGGYDTYEFDIPKECLTMDIIETIQRLNS